MFVTVVLCAVRSGLCLTVTVDEAQPVCVICETLFNLKTLLNFSSFPFAFIVKFLIFLINVLFFPFVCSASINFSLGNAFATKDVENCSG